MYNKHLDKADHLSVVVLRWVNLKPEEDKFYLMAHSLVSTFDYFDDYLRKGPRLKGRDDNDFGAWCRPSDEYPMFSIEQIKKVVENNAVKDTTSGFSKENLEQWFLCLGDDCGYKLGFTIIKKGSSNKWSPFSFRVLKGRKLHVLYDLLASQIDTLLQ